MRLLASQLRDITNAVRRSKEDAKFANILKSALERASYEKDSLDVDLEHHEYSQVQIDSLVNRLKDYHYAVKVTTYKEDGYTELTISW